MAPASSRRTPLLRKAIASPESASPQQTEEPNPPCQKVRTVLVAPGQCRRGSASPPSSNPSPRRTGTLKVLIDLAVDLDREHARDGFWLQDARAVERAAGGERRVEAGHVAGGGDTAGAWHRRAVEGERLHDAENLQSPRIGPVRGMEFGDPVLAIDGKTDVRVDHAQRAGDLGTQIVRVLPAIEPTHELRRRPTAASGGDRRWWCPAGWSSGMAAMAPMAVSQSPQCAGVSAAGVSGKPPRWERTCRMRDAVLAVSAERRPMRGDRVIEPRPAALDLLQKRDRGERLGPGEEREERVRATP